MLSLPRWRDERAENRAGEQELQVCREVSGAVPAAAAVEELATARAQEGEDVLEVGGGARRGTERRRIERAAARGEEDEARETAADLEAARADVLVRQAVAREVEDRPQEERREPRPTGGTGRGARRHMKRDDHGYRPSRWARETRADATLVGERLEDIGAAADPLRTASRTMGGQLNSRARQHKKERWAELANEAFVLLRGG